MEYKKLSISNNTAISAIYFALLQCGYDFYSIKRDASTVDKLRSFIVPDSGKYGLFTEPARRASIQRMNGGPVRLDRAAFLRALEQRQVPVLPGA